MNMYQVQMLMIMLDARMAKARSSERGASAVEWVVISGLVAGIAIAIAAILMRRLSGTAEGIKLTD